MRGCLTDLERGEQQGAADMNLVTQPFETNGHDHSSSAAVRARAQAYGHTLHPSPFCRGYNRGADLVAQLSIEARTRQGPIPRHLSLARPAS